MKKILLILILFLSLLLRIWKIDSFPVGLNSDEAALGYNAYSLLTTGKDEHGHSWPVNLESFGDFKPAGYAYLLIPFIKVFGLNEFAVRLPSVIFGVLGVLGIYLLVQELNLSSSPSPESGEGNERGEVWARIAALLLAISPWHLHFSRGAWETNVATTLITFGVYFFLLWLKKPKLRYLLLITGYFSLSTYFYQSARLIAPALGFGLLILYWKDFWKQKRQFLIAVGCGILLLLPLIISVIRTDAASRFTGVGFLADEGPLNRARELRGQHEVSNSPVARLLHFRQGEYVLRLVRNYMDHFDGNFLFVNGDVIQRNKVPEIGLFYITDFIFLVIGAFYLLRSKIYHLTSKIVWLWLFIAPIAAAVTFQTPHALRAHNMVIPMIIIISYGMYRVLGIRSSVFGKYWKLGFYFLLSTFYLYQTVRYLHQYYIHYPQTYPAAWEHGFKELVEYTKSVENKYQKIWVTDKYDQPYILFLFYSAYDPSKFQGNHKLTFRDKYNFSTVRDYDKYHFASISWPDILKEKNTLIIAAPEEVPNTVGAVRLINFPNGQSAFKIISN